MGDLKKIKYSDIKKEKILFQQNETGNSAKEYTMYTWKDEGNKVHQIFYKEPDEYENLYLTMSVPNGVLVPDGDLYLLVTYKNYDEYAIQYKKELNELGIHDGDDLRDITKYNASKKGSIELAKFTLEAIRNDYPEYKSLSDDELIQEMFNTSLDEIEGHVHAQLDYALRKSYTFDDYAKEIQGHAQLYIGGIGEESSKVADISPYDPTYQSVIWEVLP